MNREIAKKFRLATSAFRVLPNFVILGAQKSGTTTLFETLADHPQIIPPFNKEAHYFDNNFDKSLNFGYRFHFPLKLAMRLHGFFKNSSFITGEATPFYLFHPLVPKRMKGVLPNAKFLVILREPVERAYSHYQYAVKNGNETRTFEDAIANEIEEVNAEKLKLTIGQKFNNRLLQNNAYISRSCYYEQLNRWFKWYKPEQFFVFSSEYFFQYPEFFLKEIHGFLGVPKMSLKRSLPIANPNAYKAMNNQTFQQLKAYFQPLNEALFDLIDKQLWWG
jgi:hypothetical protein